MEIKPIREKWSGTLTDRERFRRQMHFEDFDRCFNMEFGYWDENFSQWKIFTQNEIQNNEQADIFFNFDEIHVFHGKWWMNPPFKGEVVEETDTTKIVINADGVYEEIPKDGHEVLPRFLKSIVTKPEDWQRLKAERFRLDDPGRKLPVEKLKEKYPDNRTYPLGIHTGSMIGKIRDLLTFEGLAYAMYDYPDMVEDMIETCCLLAEDILDQLLPQFQFDFAAGWEDIAFKNGPIVSVKFFENVVVPRYKRIGKKLREAGIDIWYIDCDGDVRSLVPGFLEAGVNCMFPYEVNGSGHPGELLEKYGKDLLIMGGFDKMVLREGKSAIREYMETLIPLVERGGFIPFLDHRCPPDVKEGNYLYYLDLKEEIFGLN